MRWAAISVECPAAGEEAGAQEREDVCAARRDRSKQVQVRGPQCKQRDAAVLRRRENGREVVGRDWSRLAEARPQDGRACFEACGIRYRLH